MSNDYSWLISSRANSQRLLVELHSFIRDNGNALASRNTDWSILALLIGAAFSLWRAAFLSFDADRTPSIVIGNAETFLKTLIQDNAINYPQDRATAAWTSGYYLNGARYRLEAVLDKFANAGRSLDHPEYLKFKNLHAGGIRSGEANAVWDQLYTSTVVAFEQFKSGWSGSAA